MQPTKPERILSIITALLLVAIMAHTWQQTSAPAQAAEGDSNFTNVVTSGDITVGDDLTVTDDASIAGDITGLDALTTEDLTVNDDLTVTDDATITSDLTVGGNVALGDGTVTQSQDTENLGQLPTWLSVPVTFTDKTLATVDSGEIWYIHDVIMNVTTNYDCTGNDCAVVVGDGDDADGFLVLADATLQVADVDGPTGFEAGFQGFLAATKGVYFDEATSEAHHGFIFSGTDTILFDVSGTDPVAGVGVVYIYYTRLE